MNNWILHIIFLIFSVNIVAQSPIEKKWEQERKTLEYRRSPTYKGPSEWYQGSSPKSIARKSYSRSGKGTINSKPGSQNKGGLAPDPTIKRPDNIQRTSTEAPDLDVPDVSTNFFSGAFWKYLLFFLIAVVVVVVIYLIIKNRNPTNDKVAVEIEDDWNPEMISKSELQLRLEAAMAEENYRECVRIYFTFILKELIKKSWIFWKKEKTNYHYVIEMRQKPNAFSFEECVRIYDIIWYGDYKIDRPTYNAILPTLAGYYSQLESKNE